MPFLHSREHLSAGDLAIVYCDHQCNVLMMDDSNFRRFKSGSGYEYLGGFYRRLPAKLSAPRSDYWNVVIHLGGASARIRHSVQFVKAAA